MLFWVESSYSHSGQFQMAWNLPTMVCRLGWFQFLVTIGTYTGRINIWWMWDRSSIHRINQKGTEPVWWRKPHTSIHYLFRTCFLVHPAELLNEREFIDILLKWMIWMDLGVFTQYLNETISIQVCTHRERERENKYEVLLFNLIVAWLAAPPPKGKDMISDLFFHFLRVDRPCSALLLVYMEPIHRFLRKCILAGSLHIPLQAHARYTCASIGELLHCICLCIYCQRDAGRSACVIYPCTDRQSSGDRQRWSQKSRSALLRCGLIRLRLQHIQLVESHWEGDILYPEQGFICSHIYIYILLYVLYITQSLIGLPTIFCQCMYTILCMYLFRCR